MTVDTESPEGQKYACPVCGCPSSLINDPRNIVDLRGHLRRCPRCGSILRGLGRIYMVAARSCSLDAWRSV